MKKKILVTNLLLVLIPTIIIGVLCFTISKHSVFSLIDQKLQIVVGENSDSASTVIADAKHDLETLKSEGTKRALDEARNLQVMIPNKIENLEELKDKIAKIRVSETGYAFVLDYNGSYVVSKDRKADGKKLINLKDSNGNYFIREMVSKARNLYGNEIGTTTYFWKNADEKTAREKVVTFFHDPKLKWIVGVSCYYDEIAELDIVNNKIAMVKKKLNSVRIGENGYMFVLDSKGQLISHPTHEGKNVLKYDYIKDMIARKDGVMRYEFEGVEKIVAFKYIKELDWYVAAGSALSDFMGPINVIGYSILALISIFIVGAVIIGTYFSKSISDALESSIKILEDECHQNLSVASKVADISYKLSETSNEQAAATQESVASMEEMSAMIERTNDFADASHQMSIEVAKQTTQGNKIVGELGTSMELIKSANDQLENMSNIIKDISSKTNIINDIVFKTQLLSFNASIEAARAGQHGKGFAVVAEEVGKLADISGDAAKEIRELLDDSQRQVETIVTSTKSTVEEGQRVSVSVQDIFHGISEQISKINGQMSGIVDASKEQAEGIKQTSVAMGQLDVTTHANSAMSKDISVNSQRLNKSGDTFVGLVSSLKMLVFGNNGKATEQQVAVAKTIQNVSAPIEIAAQNEEALISELVDKKDLIGEDKSKEFSDDLFS